MVSSTDTVGPALLGAVGWEVGGRVMETNWQRFRQCLCNPVPSRHWWGSSNMWAHFLNTLLRMTFWVLSSSLLFAAGRSSPACPLLPLSCSIILLEIVVKQQWTGSSTPLGKRRDGTSIHQTTGSIPKPLFPPPFVPASSTRLQSSASPRLE